AQARAQAHVPARGAHRARASAFGRGARDRVAAAARPAGIRRGPHRRRGAMSYELIVFDWDGTLMDSTGVIAASLQAACRDVGIAVPPERDARFVIGLGLADTFNHVAPGLDEEGKRRVS